MTPRAVVIANERQTHQVNWGGSFALGLRRHGWHVDIAGEYRAADLLVMWGVRRRDILDRARADGATICILERGYIGNRFDWSSVAFGGGLNGRGIFHGPFSDGRRWEKHFGHSMKPWRDSERGDVLIMEQIPNDQAVLGHNLRGFYRRATQTFADQGFTVRRRPHPNMSPAHGMAAIELARRSLEMDLSLACMAVTYNSNSGVDAVLAGVPTIAVDVGSMAWAVAGHDFTIPPKPDRVPWARALAWKQFRIEEMISGFCWEHVGQEWVLSMAETDIEAE